ncbi:MAG: DUF2335 domain-containing protein [Saprospiraceae bacterium]
MQPQKIKPPAQNEPPYTEPSQEDALSSDVSEDDQPEIAELTSDLPPERRAAIMSLFRSYRGPVPPPDFLKGYNDVVNNGAERLFAMVEENHKFSMEMRRYDLKQFHTQKFRGQLFIFLILSGGVGGSIFLAMHGHDIFAGGLLTAVFASSVLGTWLKKEDDIKE